MKTWMNLMPLVFTAMTSWAHADGIVLKALSETIYVPAYSEVLIGPGNSQQMAVTIVIHNVDPEQPVNLQMVTYHDHHGKQVKSLLQEAITIPPFGSWKHLIDIKGVRFLYTKKILELTYQHLVKGFDYKQFRRTDYLD